MASLKKSISVYSKRIKKRIYPYYLKKNLPDSSNWRQANKFVMLSRLVNLKTSWHICQVVFIPRFEDKLKNLSCRLISSMRRQADKFVMFFSIPRVLDKIKIFSRCLFFSIWNRLTNLFRCFDYSSWRQAEKIVKFFRFLKWETS